MRNLIKASIIAILVLLIGGQIMNAKTKRALLVGISDYGNAMEDPNKWSNINGANDIPLLTPLLQKQGYSVKSLVNKQATYAKIVVALKTIIRNSEKGDEVYLHFSMHGQPFEDLNGDEEDGWDEALIPVDAQMLYSAGVYEGKNHLLDDELVQYINQLRNKLGPSGNLYVILDACHSGNSARGDEELVRGTKTAFSRSGKEYSPDRTRSTNDYFTVTTKKGQSPVTFIEACRSYESNNEYFDKKSNKIYGSLSFFIAQAIKENKRIGSEEWIESIKLKKREAEIKKKKYKRQNIVIEKSK